MVQFVFTPWRNRAELLLARQHLFPTFTPTTPPPPASDPWWTSPAQLTDLSHALARVFLWTHRGGCPHVVESTALLLQALVLDEQARSGGGGAHIGQVAVISNYVTAFTRFVTGLLDSHQDKARKQSMYGVARTLGLPAAFVELRHQGTHEPLPGLAQLRPAAREALGWIWEYYWRNLPAAAVEGEGAVAVAVDMEAVGRRICRSALLEFLQRPGETVGGVRDGLMRRLRRWELGLVVEVLVEIGGATRDRGMLERSVRLARTILGEEGEGGEGLGEEDEATLKQELILAQSKAERLGEGGWGLSGTGKRKMGNEEAGEGNRDRKRGGWFKQKGPWVPRPIGTL